MKKCSKFFLISTLFCIFDAKSQDLVFDIPEPDISALQVKSLWATYYHIWSANESTPGLSLLNKNNKEISVSISKKDWCMGAIEGTILLNSIDGNSETFNYVDHKGTQQVNCAEVLDISPIKKPWINATGKSRYRKARGKFGDGVLDYKLIPYRTIAVDKTVIPYGSVIYIPKARGVSLTLPSGLSIVHDGFFFSADTGGAIKGNHIDVFSGTMRSNPFPSFVRSSSARTFRAFLVTNAEISNKLKSLHH